MDENSKSDARVDENKAAVSAMRGAMAAMSKTLSRVDALEHELKQAKNTLQNLKPYVGPYAAIYDSRTTTPQKVVDVIDVAVAKIEKALT